MLKGLSRCLYLFLFVFVLITFPTAANQTGTMVKPENIIAVLSADWNDDGDFDRALLVINENKASQTDLLIYLSDSQTQTLKQALYVKDFVWRGSLWGTQPELKLGPEDSLMVHSQNDAIGRNRWYQALTLRYQLPSQSFVIETFRYDARDTLDLDYKLGCTVDYLKGEVTKNGKKKRFAAQVIPAQSWNSDSVPKVCLE